ncbi:hypothetical protein Acy02nite_12320 [Actinoplanes cyaneus]|uniref:Uncharacterized protein n=1 Tax=Actinoplanes cyaneus TaxID=52696 RepID=A0A919M9S9_9ACTN|nr:hypothetical protein Acy02nite_12320 [Actinoplanes cyaneus]
MPITYTRVKHPVTSSADCETESGSNAHPMLVTRMKVRERRRPPNTRAGSAPSRASATPSLLAPAKYAFTAPSVSTTATTAVTPRTGPPSPIASRSASGARLRARPGPSASTLTAATAR